MTRPRAADDFPAIRARMEELRTITRPRAADDFATIRERVKELRRERARAPAEPNSRPQPDGPRPYAVSARPLSNRAGYPPDIIRRLSGRSRV